MRRSDEEFKAELKARARKYRAARERRRVAALKTVSGVMAACLLIVVISQVDFSWIGENPDISTEENTSAEESSSVEQSASVEESTSLAIESTLSGEEATQVTEDRDNTASGVEETEPQMTENATIGEDTETEENVESPEDESAMGDVTSDSAELKKTVSSLSIKVGDGVNWQAGNHGDIEQYEGSEEAERLSKFLEELSRTLLKPEGDVYPSGEASNEEASGEEISGKKYGIAVRYSDGTRVIYFMVQGTKTGRIAEDTIMLDQTDWATLMELFDLVRGN